jgi:hypothetical protein
MLRPELHDSASHSPQGWRNQNHTISSNKKEGDGAFTCLQGIQWNSWFINITYLNYEVWQNQKVLKQLIRQYNTVSI